MSRVGSVLVAGATGYLGQALANRLGELGWETHVLVRPTSSTARLEQLDPAPTIHVHPGTASGLIGIMEEAAPSTVVNLASRYVRNHVPGDIEALVASNVLLAAQLLEAAAQTGVRRLVSAGSYFTHYDTDQYRALNLYAATKQAARDLEAYYADAHGIRTVLLTVFDVYGPADPRPKLVNAVRDAQRSGTPLPVPDEPVQLDLVYVDDVVEAFIQGIRLLNEESGVAGHEFAVTSGTLITIDELVETFKAVTGQPVPVRRGTYALPQRRISAPWRGPALPGWAPTVDLAEGIRRVVEGR